MSGQSHHNHKLAWDPFLALDRTVKGEDNPLFKISSLLSFHHETTVG